MQTLPLQPNKSKLPLNNNILQQSLTLIHCTWALKAAYYYTILNFKGEEEEAEDIFRSVL